MPTDSERLDWLEKVINEQGALMLHDGSRSNFGCSGLGLRPGYLTRTLREAIDSAFDHQSTPVHHKEGVEE